jgi:SAM-dependent methyltransferase
VDFASRRTRNAAPNSEAAWSTHWRENRGVYVDEPLWVSTILDRVKLSYLRPMLPERGTIAEFGCGSGRLLRFAASHGLDAIGVDFSEEALSVARDAASASGLELTLMVGDARRTPLPTASVDVVATTGLLEHFEDEDVAAIVSEMVRVLKPGGLFYSDVVPAKVSLYRSLLWLRRNPVEVWERNFSRRDIERLLERQGLERVDVFGAGVFPPIIPLIDRSVAFRSILGRIVQATLPFWKMWDRTPVADLLGYYYFATGRKPVAPGAS